MAKRILITGTGTSGSWKIRGEQLGAAIGAEIMPRAALANCRRADVVVLVKRASPEALSAIKAAGLRVVWDVVVAWPQRPGHAMTERAFRDIVDTAKAPVRWTLPAGKVRMVENTNELLGRYDGMNGIKTGWTSAAGGCLAASAQQGGLELIAIVMQAESPEARFTDARKLLDYGFAQTKLRRGISRDRLKKSVWVRGGKQATVAVHPVEDVNYPLIGGEEASHYTITYDLPKIIAAPTKEGQIVGRLLLNYDGQPVGSVDLAAEKVDAGMSAGSLLVRVFGWLLPTL